MNDPIPLLLGVYRHAETNSYLVEGPCILFMMKGISYRLEGPGAVVYSEHDDQAPHLVLMARGMKLSFNATSERENGYIEFQASILRCGRAGFMDIKEGNQWIEVPCSLPLSTIQTSSLRDEFEILQAAWSVPIPRNLFKVKVGIMGLLRLFVDRAESPCAAVLSPAQEMRRLIDADRKAARNLAELSRRCGYSSDHMRKLFSDYYHLSPKDYRNRQRMSRAMDLVANSELPLPEIAAETGFHYVTNFCASFKKTFCMTPSQGRKRFRQKSESATEFGK